MRWLVQVTVMVTRLAQLKGQGLRLRYLQVLQFWHRQKPQQRLSLDRRAEHRSARPENQSRTNLSPSAENRLPSIAF